MRKRFLCFIFAMVFVMGLVSCTANISDKKFATMSGTIVKISKYGNITLSITKDAMAENSYAFGDVVTVSFAGKSIDVPYCGSYSDVDTGQAGLFGRYDEDNIALAVNLGDFATTYGLAEKKTHEDNSYDWVYHNGIDEKTTFSVTMKAKRGYIDEYTIRQLSYSDQRSDFSNLTDEQFGNFRVVSTTGMGKNILYRSASPVDPQRNRNTYVDEAAKNHGITVILNLDDTKESLVSFPGFDSSYSSTANYITLNMGMDFTQEDYKQKLCDGLRFMSKNKGVYLIHCLEGKNRTGFVIAILEFLMGASYEEAEDDYMVTFFNYYGVQKGEEKYDIIASSSFRKIIQRAFGVDSLENEDLSELANDYCLSIGLTEEEMSSIKSNLS